MASFQKLASGVRVRLQDLNDIRFFSMSVTCVGPKSDPQADDDEETGVQGSLRPKSAGVKPISRRSRPSSRRK